MGLVSEIEAENVVGWFEEGEAGVGALKREGLVLTSIRELMLIVHPR